MSTITPQAAQQALSWLKARDELVAAAASLATAQPGLVNVKWNGGHGWQVASTSATAQHATRVSEPTIEAIRALVLHDLQQRIKDAEGKARELGVEPVRAVP